MTNVNARMLAIVLVAGCGGSALKNAATPAAAVGLDYTDPASAADWRLSRDPSSTVTRLVLNLIGPAGQKGRGVGFNLRSDGTVKFAKFENGSYINDLGVFQLGNKYGAINVVDGTPATKDVGTIVGGVKEGGHMLTVGAYQKDRRWDAQAVDQPLYQIAISFDPGQQLRSGTVIPLVFVKARSIPEAIGDNPEDPAASVATWAYQYRIDDVKVVVGKLVAL